MTTVAPPPPPAPPPGPLPATAETAVARSVPEAVARLAAGARLEAVVEMLQRGVAAVRTDLGRFELRTPLPLPPDARLVLQLLPAVSGGQAAFRVLSVDGRPPGQMAAAQMPAAQTSAAQAPAGQPPGAGQAAAGTGGDAVARAPSPATTLAARPPADAGMTAMLLRPAEDGMGGLRLPQNATFPVRLVSLQTAPAAPPGGQPPGAAPASAAPPMPQAAPPGGAPAAPPGLASPASLTTPPGSPAPVPGQSSAPAMPGTPPAGQAAAAAGAPASSQPGTAPPVGQAPPVAQAPPAAVNAPPSAAAAAAMPAMLNGVVAANSHFGQPLVQTQIGLVAVETAATLPPGATVTLQVVGPPSAPTQPVMPNLPPAEPGKWPVLQQAADALRQADPAAEARLKASLPEVGPRLAAGMMAFAASARLGNPRGWLGEQTIEALDRSGRRDLARRVSEEFSEATAKARAPGGDWRVLNMPLLNGAAIEPIRFYVKRPPPDDEDEGEGGREEAGDRFVVDLDLSRFGRLQLDGLIRRRSKRFDLILRSAAGLPDAMRHDIAAIFAKSLDGLGMSGGVSFQVTRRFFEPPPEPASLGPGVLV